MSGGHPALFHQHMKFKPVWTGVKRMLLVYVHIFDVIFVISHYRLYTELAEVDRYQSSSRFSIGACVNSRCGIKYQNQALAVSISNGLAGQETMNFICVALEGPHANNSYLCCNSEQGVMRNTYNFA